MPELPVNLSGTPTYKRAAGASSDNLSVANREYNPLNDTSLNYVTPKKSGYDASSITMAEAAGDRTGRFKTVMYGYDNEEAAAQRQSILDKGANGILKGVNLTATTIAGGFGMLYGAAKAPFTGRLADIWDNGVMRRLDDWNREVDDKILPNYYTKAERDAAWYSPTNWFTANFLFDKLIKNSGYAVGAMISGNIANAGLLRAGAALGRAASAGAIAAESSQAFKIFTPLLRNTARAFSAGKNVEAAAALESQISSIADITAKSSELAKIAKTTGAFSQFSDAARRTAIAAYSSAGESSFEALQTANQFRDSLIQEYVDRYGEQPTGQDLEDINTKADQVGKTSFLGNLALLSATEYVQLPYLLGSSYRTTKQAANVFANRVDDVLAKAPDTKLGKITEKVTGIGRYIFDPKEAGQEVGQYALQVGTQNYFNKASMSEDANVWVDGFLYGFVGRDEEGKGEGVLVSKEGMESFLLGGLTGGPMQARGKMAEKKAKTENTTRFLEQIEIAPSFKEAFVDKMNSVNRGVVLQEQHEAAIVTGNELEARDLRADMTHNYLAPRIKYGRFDMVMDDISELREMSSTETGLADLKAQGIANVNDTISTFQKRLNNFETTAKNTNEIYNGLYIRYAGERLENGNPKYSSYVLDKMAYAASKIANYDVRIPQLNNILTENGIVISELLDTSLKGKKPTRQATSDILNQINELSTTSTVKDGLKTALQDIIKLGEHRKIFMEEYEDIKANPLNYEIDPDFNVGDSIELPVSVVQKVPKEKGKRRKVKEQEKKIQVGREYSLAEPIRKDGTVLHLAPKLTVLSQTLGGELEVKLPGGKVTFMAPEDLKNYNLSEQDNTSDELAKILDDSIDTVLAKDKYKELPKMEEGETKLAYLNSLGDQAVVDDVEKEFNKRADEYIKTVLDRKRREDELKKNKAALDQQQETIQQNSGGLPTGDPTKEVPYVEPPLKDEAILFRSTTTESEGSETWEADVTKSDPHIQRSREFLNNAKKFKNRPNLRTILVNYRNVDLLKLTGMIQMSYSLDKGADINSIPDVKDVSIGFIAAVFVEQDGADLHFVDKNGNRIGKVGVDAPSLDAIIFQTMPTTDLTNSKNKPRYRSGQEKGAALYSKAWDIYRHVFWDADPSQYPVSDFFISRGRPRKLKTPILDDKGNPVLDSAGKPVMQNEKNHVGDILIPNNLLSLVKGFIEIPTTGTISHNGETITFPKGRPVAHFGDTLQFLNNSKFSDAQANTIFQVIKAMADDVSAKVAAGKPVELGVRYTSFLQNVMWWNTRANPVENQIFVDTNTMELSIGKKKFPLLQIASFQGEIVGDLLNTYHSVNKNTLDNKFDQKFYELYAVKDKTTGQTTIEEREWTNYQTYLLGATYPDGKARPIEQTPLYTDVAKSEPGIPYSFAQKYAVLSAMDLPVQKVATPAPAPTVTPSDKPKVGDYTVDGETQNTIGLMEPFGKTNFTAIEEESRTLPDGTITPVFRVDAISEGIAELVKKKEAGDPMAIKQFETYRQILRSANRDEASLTDAQVGNVIANISISSKLVNMKKAEQAAATTAAVLQPNVSPLAQAQGTARTEPVVTQAPVQKDRKTEIVEKLNSIRGKSLGFSSRQSPGTTKYTEDGTKVEFIKSQRDKYNRGNEIFRINDDYEILVDYNRRPSNGFSDNKELPFDADYSENPKALFDELKALEETKPAPVVSDKKADIEKRRQDALTYNENYDSTQDVGKAVPGYTYKKDGFGNKTNYKGWASDGTTLSFITAVDEYEYVQKVNSKYDAELAALEEAKPAETYKGIQVIDSSSIKTATGEPGAAQYNRAENKILVNRELLKKKFDEKAWTKPRKQKDGSFATALPENAFATYEEFEKFVIEHEFQHSLLSYQESGAKTVGEYEDIINRRALGEGAPVSDKKADIERRRSSSLRNINQTSLNFDAGRGYAGVYNLPGTEIIDSNGKPSGLFKTEIIREDTKEEVEKELNARYDAELVALEGTKPASSTPPIPGPGKFKAPGAEGDFREVGRGEEKLERISSEELNLFKKWAAENLPTIPYEILDNIIKINSTRNAWGVFENGVAKFMKTGLRGTEYHEMGEAVWNGMLSPEEQQAIIADERSKGGTFVDRASGKTLEYATATDRQVKERIMDDFSDYRLGKLPARSLKERVLRFFKAIMDFFKSVVNKPSLKDELFKAIDTGKFKTRTMFPSVYNAAAEYRAVAGLTEQETREFVDDMTARAAIYLFRDAKKLLYNPGQITGAEVFGYIKSRYDQVDAEFKLSDEVFNQLAEKTRNRLRTIGIVIGEDDRVSVNGDNNNSRDYAPEPFSIDWKKNSPGAIKFMLATLIKVKPTNQQDLSLASPEAMLSTNIDGYQLVNFSRSFATVLDKLSNTSSIQEAVNKVFELAKDDANYISFVKRLGGNLSTATMQFDQFKDEDWRLFINFYQAFTKQKPDAVIEYISGNDVYTGSANLQSAKRQVQNKWIENIKAMAQDPKSIIKYNSGSKEKTYDVNTNVLNGLPTKSVANKIDFLSALGIQFPMEAWQRLSDKPTKRKGKSDQQKFDEAVEAIKTYFGTERSIFTLKGKTLKVGGPMSTLAELYAKTTNPDQSNVYIGVEGTQVGSYADSNTPSVFENEFNESNTLDELKEKRPELNDVFSNNSLTLKSGGLFYNTEGDSIRTFKVGYIQGGKNVETDRALSNSRISLGYRFTQEINQNVDGNYYILNPGDGSTPWMMNIGNNVSYENIAAGRGWKQIFEIFNGYLEDDIALALDWKNRSKITNIGDKAKELRFFKEILPQDILDDIDDMIDEGESLKDIMAYVKENAVDINESVRVFINNTVAETKQILMDGRQVNVAGEDLFSYGGLNSDFATREKINKNKMSEDVLNNLLTFVNANYVIANIEYHKILFGDPYQFKITDKDGTIILDETKRIKSFLSPRRVTFDFVEYNNFLNTKKNKVGEIDLQPTDGKGNVTPGYHVNKSYTNTVTITDDNIVGSLANVMAVYGEKKGKGAVNVADAASWLMDNTYREIKRKNAQWGDDAEAFHQWQMAYTRKQLAAKGLYEYPEDGALKEYDASLTSKPSPRFVLEVIKPIVTGNKYDKSNFNLVLDKFSQMPIYYSMVENTNLENLYLKMMNSGMGYAIVESGRKVGAEGSYNLYNADGSINNEPFNNMIQVPWKAYGIQVENSYESDKQQTRGSQLTKIVTIDLFENGIPVSKEALKAFQRNTQILNQMHENAYKELLIKLGIEDLGNGFVLKDGRAISEALTYEMLRRELSDNAIDTLQLDENNEFRIPFEASPSYQQIKNIMYSFIHKAVSSPKMNGGAHVQVPVTGFENLGSSRSLVRKVDGKFVKLSQNQYEKLSADEKKSVFLTDSTLKFYTKDAPYMEVLLPHWFKVKMGGKFKDEKALLDYLNKTEEGKKILRGVGFRIPTQSISSAEVFRVKGFLPEYMGMTVVVPAEITTKAGSDFDIDKLNMYLKSIYIDKNGNIRLVKYQGSEKATKEFFASEFDEIVKNKVIRKNELREAADIRAYGLPDPNGLEEKYSNLLDTLLEDVEDPAQFNEKITKELENLQDADIQAVLKEKYIKDMYKRSLENEYYESLEEILTLPEVFDRMIVPVDDAGLSEEAARISKLRGEQDVRSNRILDRNYMTSLRHLYVMAKNWIGIVAVNITSHSQMQKAPTYIDPKRFMKASEIDRKFLGNGEIYLPHNKVDVGEEIEFISLAGRTTADGSNQLISNRLSGYGTATVDVVKDPYLGKIIRSGLLIGPAMFLERIGAGKTTIDFLNQPIIVEYVKMLDSKNIRNLFNTSNIDLIRAKFGGIDETVIGARFNVNNLENNIESYYKGKLNKEQELEQQKILTEFLKYAKMAEHSYKFTQAINYDTTKFRSGEALSRKQFRTQKAVEENIICCVEFVIEDTFLKVQSETLDAYRQAMGAVFKTEQDKFRFITENIVMRPYAEDEYLSNDDFETIANKIKASFLDYIILTKTDIGLEMGRLMVNPDTNIATRVMEAAKKYPNLEILQKLEPATSERADGAKSLKLSVNDKTAEAENYNQGLMRELRDYNSETNALYYDIVKVSILQGTYTSPISIRNIIPIEDFQTIITPVINTLADTEGLKAFEEGSFQRTNFRDDKIVPVVQPKFFLASEDPVYEQVTMFGDHYADIYQYYSSLFPNIDVFGIKSTERKILELSEKYNSMDVDNLFVKVPRVVTDKSSGEMIDMQTGETITKQDFAIRKQKGDPSLNDFYGYKKVLNFDDSPVTYVNQKGDTIHVYKLVNLYGDSPRTVEHHSDFTPSPINNGTVKITTEIPDGDIIKYYDGKSGVIESKDVVIEPNKPEFSKLPSKSATPIMIYAGVGSRQTPPEVLAQMTEVAKELEAKGYTLRSGAAEGADAAFESGVKSKKEIFKGFDPTGEREIEIAHEIHPNLKGAMEAAKRRAEAKGKNGERSAWAVQNLMARNTNQVFGENLDTPVDFVLFYAEEVPKSIRPKGGTGQAVEMARRKGIPTINMADANWREQLDKVLTTPVREYTPENITSLKPNEVFVFGSNTEGRHGAGAALTAKEKFGAKQGQAEGLQGQSYAIITKDLAKGKRSIPLYGMDGDSIAEKVRDFVDFANSNPQLKFYVTKLGSELAGYSIDEIKNIFDSVNKLYVSQDIENYIPNNVVLPKEYEVRVTEAQRVVSGKSIFESRTNPLNYTTDQTKALMDIQKLIDNNKQAYYLLAGYAGTGKTTIAENIANYAIASGRPVGVIAPTNKAAKVLNDKLKASGLTAMASTIHSAIYGQPDPETGEWITSKKAKNSLILVDESSMISKEVMNDLLNVVYGGNNILVFMGDSFQLEPVGEDPGLFKGGVSEIGDAKSELKEVRRQSLDSNILKIATVTRIDDKAYIPSESIANFEISSSKAKFVGDFRNAIAAGESAVAIVATNNERMMMNQAARMSKFGADRKVVEEGESVISVANATDFPNAETFTLVTLDGEPTIHPITFEARDGKKSTYDMHLTYFRTQNGTSRKMFFFPNLDKPSLYHSDILKAIKESNRPLFESLNNDFDIIPTKKGYKLNPNIIIGTYGYAVTAHKSQGSQWEKVFVNQNYVAPTWNTARWYYTAITRSSKDVIVLPQSANVKITPIQMESVISKVAQPDIIQPSEGTDPFTCKQST